MPPVVVPPFLGANAILADKNAASVCTQPDLIANLSAKVVHEAAKAPKAAEQGPYVADNMVALTQDNRDACPTF